MQSMSNCRLLSFTCTYMKEKREHSEQTTPFVSQYSVQLLDQREVLTLITIAASVKNRKLWAKSNVAVRKWKNNLQNFAFSSGLNIL